MHVAQRELQEEAGLVAQRWEPLSTTCSSPGMSSEVVRIYLANDLTPAPLASFEPADEEADMEVLPIPFDVLLDAALTGRVSNAQLVIAVTTYELKFRNNSGR